MVLQPINRKVSMEAGIFKIDSKIYVGVSSLRKQLIEEFHDHSWSSHSGFLPFKMNISIIFYWPKMKEDVRTYIAECVIFQTCKSERVPYQGLLQPLDTPSKPWSNISIDFY